MAVRCAIRKSFVGISVLAVVLLVTVTTKVTKNQQSVITVERLVAPTNENNAGQMTSDPVIRHTLINDSTRPKVVIVLAYMHTGSSYIGELLRQIPSTFYEFEPLRSAQMSILSGVPLLFLNGTTRRYETKPGDRIGLLPAVDHLQNIVTCNHHQLDVGTNTNFFFGSKSHVYRDYTAYIDCVAGHSSPRKERITKYHSTLLPQTYLSVKHVKKCVHLMEAQCFKAKVRLSKYIRLSLEAAYNVVRILNNVRVIHLVRDPRAMMDSQLRKNDLGVNKNISKFEQRTKMMCGKMREDLEFVQKVHKEFPGVLFTQRYENIVDKPIETAKEIYEFVGEEFTANIERFVRAKSIDSAQNSTVRQAIWRSHITTTHLAIVDKHCSDLYDWLGYIHLTKLSQVRDLSIADYLPDVDMNKIFI